MIPPCGVPLSVSCSLPSSITPAFTHFISRRTMRLSPIRCSMKCLQMSMVDGVEERLDICVEHPADLPLDRFGESIERVVLRPSWSKPVRDPDKLRLVDRLEHHLHRLLDDLVFQRRDAERSRPPIAFRDVHAPHWLRMIAATMDSVLQIEQAFVETLAVLVPGHPVHAGRCVLSKALVRLLAKTAPGCGSAGWSTSPLVSVLLALRSDAGTWSPLVRAVSRRRFVHRIFPWPRSFPPSARRALPSSSPTSRVLRPRPTSRRSLRIVVSLPALACRTP